MSSLPIILYDLHWQVGRGRNIFILLDQIVGIKHFNLSWALKAQLYYRNMVVLKQAYAAGVDHEPGWVSLKELGPIGDLAREWDDYTFSLCAAGIVLSNNSDQLVWIINNQMGVVTSKLSYLSLIKQ